MYYEKLALEVNAAASGLNVIKPAILKGKSEYDQKFTFVAVDETSTYAFDIYPEVGEREVMRTYLKKLDTGAETYIVCLQGKPTPEAAALASEYGLGMLGPGSVGDFFNQRITQQLRAIAEPMR
jgi:hypothetical protein